MGDTWKQCVTPQKKKNFNSSGKEKISLVGSKISSMEERKLRGKERKGKEMKERKESSGVFLRPMALRRLEFVGPKAKVCLHATSYAWVPEAGGFSEAPRR